MKRIVIALLVLPLLLNLTACASGPKKEEVDRLSIIESQLARILADLSVLQSATRSNNEAVAQLRKDVEEQITNLRTDRAKDTVKLDTIELRINALAERLDDAELRLTNMNKEITSLKISRSGTVFARPTDSDTLSPDDPNLNDPDSDSPDSDTTERPAAGTEAEMYQFAYSDYLRSDFQLAVTGFRNYLLAYPAGSRAEEAQFYLAESLYNQGDFDGAVEEYDKHLERFPESPNRINAMYKKGLAFLESNQTAQGVILLQQLVSRYPNSIEARLAREKLRSLGLNPQ